MHNATIRVPEADEIQAEFLAIELHLADLLRSLVSDDGQILETGHRRGRRRVIHCGQGKVGAPNRQSLLAQHTERLRRSDLVDDVQVDVEDRRRIRRLRDDYVV